MKLVSFKKRHRMVDQIIDLRSVLWLFFHSGWKLTRQANINYTDYIDMESTFAGDCSILVPGILEADHSY